MSSNLPLAVCVMSEAPLNRARTVSYPDYLYEVLAHAGVFYRTVTPDELESALDEVRVLVTVGEGELSQSTQERLTKWVEQGGAWLSIAGTCGMDALLGVEKVPSAIASWGGGLRSLGEGYLVATGNHPAVAHVRRPVHLFGGTTVRSAGAKTLARVDDKHGRQTDRPGMLENVAGKGRCMLIAADVTGTIVRIQQGTAVTRDGVPAPDGSAPVDDAVLKSDDGAVLDWWLDRDPVPGVENFHAFLEPMADAWREVVLRTIFHLAQAQRASLPVLWLYPRKLPAIAHMSHDTDGNDPAKAQRLLDVLADAKIRSTWCVILPGYDAALIEKIKSAGHELATHYDAVTEGNTWGEAQFDAQWRKLCGMFGERPVANKNHYLRWEGDTEWWEWCAKRGIQLDQSKGASKTGEAGYNFGTCQPYFPVTFRGRTIDVLELATPTQDLHVFAPEPIFEALLATVKRYHGVLHLLFHPAHVMREEVARSIGRSVRRAREQGLEWWTAKQINAWERARRTVRVERIENGAIAVRADKPLEDATILWLGGKGMSVWGFDFGAAVQTIEAGKSVTVSMK